MSKTSAAAAKASTSSHFELFGLAPAFALDLTRLDAAYRDIQSRVHPDRHAHAGAAERRASMQVATQVNEAYRLLKSAVQRAKYLLELNGVDVAFETNTAMPPEFLMQQMELREQLEDAKSTADLDQIAANLAPARRALEREIEAAIDRDRDYASAAGLVRKLMFLERFGEEIDAHYSVLEG